jgi:isopenicillin-N N-acyltransferase-like protein
MLRYGHSVANYFIDTDMLPYDPTASPQWHPRLPNMVYYGMDWLCKNYDIVLAQQLAYAAGVTGDVPVRAARAAVGRAGGWQVF